MDYVVSSVCLRKTTTPSRIRKRQEKAVRLGLEGGGRGVERGTQTIKIKTRYKIAFEIAPPFVKQVTGTRQDDKINMYEETPFYINSTN